MTRYYSYCLDGKRRIIKHDEGKAGVIIHLDKYRVNLVTDSTIKSNYLRPENFKPMKVQWSENPVIIMRRTTAKIYNHWFNHVRKNVEGKVYLDNILFGPKELNLDMLKDEMHSLISRYVAPTKTPSAHSRLESVFNYVKSFDYQLIKRQCTK